MQDIELGSLNRSKSPKVPSLQSQQFQPLQDHELDEDLISLLDSSLAGTATDSADPRLKGGQSSVAKATFNMSKTIIGFYYSSII